MTQLEEELQALVDVAPAKRAKDEPTIHVTCTWCKTVFNQDPEVDERNFLKLHEGVCVNKTPEERFFYHLHRRWPRKPRVVEQLELEVEEPQALRIWTGTIDLLATCAVCGTRIRQKPDQDTWTHDELPPSAGPHQPQPPTDWSPVSSL